ncbi:MAG: type II toxin-antitoxin system VapC family toxin [Bryobacterales bacterium]|nr:type II toxin-antitoxin system VapC family toxin [Bryobacterales bacterium]
MTLDTSAVLAILQDEPERTEFVSRIEQAARCLISTVSVLEASKLIWRGTGWKTCVMQGMT